MDGSIKRGGLLSGVIITPEPFRKNYTQRGVNQMGLKKVGLEPEYSFRRSETRRINPAEEYGSPLNQNLCTAGAMDRHRFNRAADDQCPLESASNTGKPQKSVRTDDQAFPSCGFNQTIALEADVHSHKERSPLIIDRNCLQVYSPI